MSDSSEEQKSSIAIVDEGPQRPDRWRFVPLFLGIILIAAGAADSHWLWLSPSEDLWLFGLSELKFYSGLLILCGGGAKTVRISLLAFFFGILVFDLIKTVAGVPPRLGFGHVSTGIGFNLASDFVILFALVRWQPKAERAALIDTYPARVAVIAFAATMVGIAIDHSEFGQFPIQATIAAPGTALPNMSSYLLYLPANYHWSSKRWPLILSLHGAGEIGDDLGKVRRSGLPRRVEAKRDLPFVIVAPQSIRGGWDADSLDFLLNYIMKRYRIDPERIYLTGLSMGGYGTWTMAIAYPERFAAIAPICGGGEPSQAIRLKDIPTWVFHGAKDHVVLPRESQQMVEALKQAGGNVRFTLYPQLGHNSWSVTYDKPEFYSWLLTHRRKPTSP